MSLFKRLSATVFARLDEVVSEIENHDAVIQVSVDEACKKVADAKIRLQQLYREEHRLQQQIADLQNDTQHWQRRAAGAAKENENTALECLRRARSCQQQIGKLTQAAQQYRQNTATLARDIEASEQRLREIKQKQTLMRAREASGAALQTIQQNDGETSRLVYDTFDRWELNITRTELLNDTPITMDPIEDAFLRREEEESLRDELAALLKEEK